MTTRYGAITLLILLSQIGLTVVANLFVKTGSQVGVIQNSAIMGLLNLKTMAGLLCFGGSFALYAFLLQRLPLNIAQSFLAVQFIAVIMASSIILGEPVSVLRWAGIGLIFLGIAVVAITQ